MLSRPYRDESDYLRLRALLAGAYTAAPLSSNWTAARLDVERFAVRAGDGARRWLHSIQLWEDGGALVGAVIPAGGDTACLQYERGGEGLAGDMLAWAEARRVALRPASAVRPRLYTTALNCDGARTRLLRERGYRQVAPAYCLRSRPLAGQPSRLSPVTALPPGYTPAQVRPHDPAHLAALAAANRAAFPGSAWTPHTIRLIASSPAYRADLDLIALAPDGTVAAFVTGWLDPANRTLELEPVGTHPAHRRRGLASALLAEALRRGAALGATVGYVSAEHANTASNAFYAAAGLAVAAVEWRWRKELAGQFTGQTG